MSKRKFWLVLSSFIILGLFIFIINKQVSTTHARHSYHHPLSGRTIVLDPGHGGPDGGAKGGGVHEKDVTLAIAKRVQSYLQEAGAYVILTRNEDTDLADEGTTGLSRRKTQDLKQRVKIMEEADPDCVVSIHLNAIPSSRWRGAQTFYYPNKEENKRLAIFIQHAMKSGLNNTDRLAKMIPHIYILKRAQVPAALVEVGFLSNPDERALLKTEPYQQKIAESIYLGISRYFTNEKTPAS